MKRIFILLIFIFSAVSAWTADSFKITILHTNDLHGMIKPFDYRSTNQYAADNIGGLARISTTIKQLRKSILNPIIVMDCGDIFTRGPWHTQFMGVPEIEAMNLMRYDMMCVGNNEFKATASVDSQEYMLRLMRRSRFPFLAANLTYGDTGLPVEGIHPYIIRNIEGVRVGFLGLTAPRSKDYPQTAGWAISDPISAAKKWVPIVRKECDILIAVTHISDAADSELAGKVSGIDAIVGGDSHTFLPKGKIARNPEGRIVPIAQAGEQGVVLGRLDLVFINKDGWKVANFKSKFISISSDIKEDEDMNRLLAGLMKPVNQLP